MSENVKEMLFIFAAFMLAWILIVVMGTRPVHHAPQDSQKQENVFLSPQSVENERGLATTHQPKENAAGGDFVENKR